MATALKLVFVLGVFVLGIVPLLVVLERRLSAFMQGRLGPNRIRIFGIRNEGLAQPLADLIKFLFKEDIIPQGADRFLYVFAPVLVLVPPALGFLIVPFGSEWGGERLQLADLSAIGVLFAMSALSVAVYGLAFGGWASNSKYSLLGGLRASAQVISYELTLGLSIITVLMFAESVDPNVIVQRQMEGRWNILGGGAMLADGTLQGANWLLLPAGLFGFFLFFVAALAENNRLPFDLAECEAELVGGYHTEYSSMKFALFFMGEYVGMVLMSALMVTFYLGGWSFPGLNEFLTSGTPLAAMASVAVFLAKMMVLLLIVIAIRWTIPRFKYNQLMDLGWKKLIPLSLANVLYVAVVGVLTSGGGGA